MLGPARVRGIMAPKSASQRATRQPKRRPPKKRASAVAAGKARKRTVMAAEPGMVEVALAAFAHEGPTPLTGIFALTDLLATSDLDERGRRWGGPTKAGAEPLPTPAPVCLC